MQQLLTLQAYSREKDRQEEFITEHDSRFARLMSVVRAGEMDHYLNREQILREFGQPVFKRVTNIGGIEAEEWFYREATAYFEGDRVYFYFDRQGRVVDWEHKHLPPKQQG